MMEKCNYCKMSSPEGKCFWSAQTLREKDCKKAINNMIEATKKENKKNKHWF